MGKRLGRALGMALAAVCGCALVACATTVGGVAVKASERADTDGAVVALLDTGNYPTSAGHPQGAAGDTGAGPLLEAHRIAVNVVGPWQVDATFRRRGPLANTTTTSPLNEARLLAVNRVLNDPLPAIAAAHGFITGFSSLRTAGEGKLLLNVVLRFPDADSANAAAREMADKYGYGDRRPQPAPIDGHPEAIATLYGDVDGSVSAASFTPHGPYVLFQGVQLEDRNDSAAAPLLIKWTLDKQEPLIDRFAPTDSAKLADLPKDFTGQLLARTLWAPDNSSPYMVGVWEPSAWLHFEDDPIKAAALFDSAGVDAVAQRMTTVYRARDAASAARVVDQFVAGMRATDGVSPITGVNGLPAAQCFARPKASAILEAPNPPLAVLRVMWPFKCIARAGRYAYTAFSQDRNDVKQQIAAQYRILAGE